MWGDHDRICRVTFKNVLNGVETLTKVKGIKTSTVKNTICFQDYMNCLQVNETVSRDQNRIQSYLHNVFTIVERKIALSPYDDKRCLQLDTTDTLPWGHYSINSQ